VPLKEKRSKNSKRVDIITYRKETNSERHNSMVPPILWTFPAENVTLNAPFAAAEQGAHGQSPLRARNASSFRGDSLSVSCILRRYFARGWRRVVAALRALFS